MVNLYEVQCAIWDRIHFFTCEEDIELHINDHVIVNNDSNLEMVKIVGIRKVEDEVIIQNDIESFVRKATDKDIDKMEKLNYEKSKDMDLCSHLVVKRDLSMKIVDVYYSLDGGKVTFAFSADGRVDFRGLVKDLTSHYHKSIRLQQLGVRDAARVIGDIGICGLTQCCKTHLKGLVNITMDMAESQQVAHRGSDRLAGACGRLKCCLAYELKNYEDNFKQMPLMGSVVRVDSGKKGVVCGWHILRGAVDVNLADGVTLEFPITKIKVLELPNSRK